MRRPLGKIALAAFALVIVASGFTLAPRPTHAQFVDPVNAAENLLTSISQTVQEFVSNKPLLQFLYDQIFTVFKNRVINYYYNATLDMIQGADFRDPQSITNYYNGVLAKATNAALGDVIGQLGDLTGTGVKLCQPQNWGVGLNISLTQPQPLPNQVSCTLTGVLNNVQGGVNSFINNFTTGGWLAFTESLQPQNNPWGVSFAAQGALIDALDKQASQISYDTQGSGGFAPVKTCLAWQLVGNISAAVAARNPTYIAVTDPNANLKTESPDGFHYDGKSAIPDGSDWECSMPETTTPGSVIANQTNQALNAPAQQIIDSSNLSGLLQGLANAITNRAVTWAVTSFVSSTQGAAEINDCNTVKNDFLMYSICSTDQAFNKVSETIGSTFAWVVNLAGGGDVTNAAQDTSQYTDAQTTQDIDNANQALQQDANAAILSADATAKQQLANLVSSHMVTAATTNGIPSDILATSTVKTDTALTAARELITDVSSSNTNLIDLLNKEISSFRTLSPPLDTTAQQNTLNAAQTTTESWITTAGATNATLRYQLTNTYTSDQITSTSTPAATVASDLNTFFNNITNHLNSAISQYRTSCALEEQACTDLHNVHGTQSSVPDCNINNFVCGGNY